MKRKIVLFLVLIIAILCLASCGEEDGIPTGDSSENGHTHAFASKVIPPTCTEQGYTLMECECGAVGKQNYVDAKGHDEGTVVSVSSPDCEKDGKKEKYCNTCGQLIEEIVVPKLSHVYSNKTYLATCVEKGYTTHICKLCSYTYDDTFTPLEEHDEGEPIITQNPTCKATGEAEYRCEWCDKLIRKQTLSAVACSYISYAIEKTDDKDAHTLYVCKTCGDSYEGPYVNAETLAQATAKEIYEKSKDALVEILCLDKKGDRMAVGTGFFISADGYIATNYHVIKGAYQLSITKYSGGEATTSIKVVAFDVEQDVAILKVETSDEKYLEISSSAVEMGDNVYVIGSTLGLTGTFTHGMISSPSRYINGKYCIQFTAPISGGNSGGPLLDSTGKVIGIVTLTVDQAQNLNFAIKSSALQATNNEKLDTPLDVSAHYEATLDKNAVHILKYYIMNNNTYHEDDVYYIYTFDPQTQTSLGREYYYVYDSGEDKLYIQIDLIASKTGMNRLTITVELDDNNDGKFAVSMYDYNYAQETIVGYLDHTATLKVMGSTLNQGYFDKVFPDVEIKYLETNTDSPPTTMKILFYQSYTSLVAKFANMLIASQTGITAEKMSITLPSV